MKSVIKQADPDQRYNEAMDFLNKRFPDQLMLSIGETAGVLGNSEKYIYNMTGRKSKRKPPFPIVRIGRLPKIRKHDLARYIASL